MLSFENLDTLARSRRERLIDEAREARLATPLGHSGLRATLWGAAHEILRTLGAPWTALRARAPEAR